MKRVLKNIYCGISGQPKSDGSGFDFSVDFDENSAEDIIQFIEPYFTQSTYKDNVYWVNKAKHFTISGISSRCCCLTKTASRTASI